ncbi:MAG: DoxX family membrane protein [Candidatus Velthaea sp.]
MRPPPSAALGAVLALLPSAANAHEKWFFDARSYPLGWEAFLSGGAPAWCGATVAVMAALAVVWRIRGGRDFIPAPERFGAEPHARRTMYALLPAIVGVHVAVPLFYDGTHGLLFSPNVQLHGAAAYLCGIAEIWIGLALLYGGLTRIAALALAALWCIGIPLAGFEVILDNALYLGIAAFFFLAGRGPLAVDRLMFPALEPPARFARYAVDALRMGLGASFVVVAFTEKFANLPLALAFLHRYPVNFTPFFGLPLSDRTFVLVGGSVELLLGLCLLFGVFAREMIIVAWLPINLTLTYFNAVEVVGHLPIYGIMALLLIWIPGGANRDVLVAAICRGLRPPPPRG